jgi:hypothetical protein
MFCPNCGQQQAAGETRFCSRCGFQLGVVRAVVAAGATTSAPPAPDRTQRKKDMTIGAAIMFLCAFAVAVITVDAPPSSSGRVFLLLVVWVLLSLAINLRPLWNYFFGGDVRHEAKGPTETPAQRLSGAATAASLPPAQSTPASSLREPRFDTAEVAEPPSVAERTTNLIGNR